MLSKATFTGETTNPRYGPFLSFSFFSVKYACRGADKRFRFFSSCVEALRQLQLSREQNKTAGFPSFQGVTDFLAKAPSISLSAVRSLQIVLRRLSIPVISAAERRQTWHGLSDITLAHFEFKDYKNNFRSNFKLPAVSGEDSASVFLGNL